MMPKHMKVLRLKLFVRKKKKNSRNELANFSGPTLKINTSIPICINRRM